jgi:hypothetical protein
MSITDTLLSYFFEYAEVIIFGTAATIMVMRRLRSRV